MVGKKGVLRIISDDEHRRQVDVINRRTMAIALLLLVDILASVSAIIVAGG